MPPAEPPPPPRVPAAGRPTRAGFLSRAAAALIDLGIIFCALHALAAADVVANESMRLSNFGAITFAGGGVVLVAYGLLDVLAAGTLGKKVLGLRIARPDGRPAGPAALLGRWAAKYAPLPFLAAAGFLLATTLTRYPGYSLRPFVLDGLFVLGVADAVVCLALTAFVAAGCFRVARRGRGRRAFHDVMSGTAVLAGGRAAARGFEPLPVRGAGEDVCGETSA